MSDVTPAPELDVESGGDSAPVITSGSSTPVSTTPKSNINVHPKVLAGFLTGIGVTAASAIAAYVTPESLEFLGPWAVPAATLVGTGLGLLVSWLKKTPQP